MGKQTLLGGGLTTLGLVGYVAGVYVTYPGRSFSITALMVGIVILIIARGQRTEEPA